MKEHTFRALEVKRKILDFKHKIELARRSVKQLEIELKTIHKSNMNPKSFKNLKPGKTDAHRKNKV